jgi:hypothetical protein
MAGGDSGSVMTYTGSGNYTVITCETGLRGVPYKGECRVEHP